MRIFSTILYPVDAIDLCFPDAAATKIVLERKSPVSATVSVIFHRKLVRADPQSKNGFTTRPKVAVRSLPMAVAKETVTTSKHTRSAARRAWDLLLEWLNRVEAIGAVEASYNSKPIISTTR